jgi:hypothetical protein
MVAIFIFICKKKENAGHAQESAISSPDSFLLFPFFSSSFAGRVPRQSTASRSDSGGDFSKHAPSIEMPGPCREVRYECDRQVARSATLQHATGAAGVEGRLKVTQRARRTGGFEAGRMSNVDIDKH